MRKRNLILIILAVLLFVFILRLFSDEDTWICKDGEWIKHGNPNAPQPTSTCADNLTTIKTTSTMKIESSAFEYGHTIPQKYTCDGQNVNPPLKISGVPENAKSLVLIMDDPDAPAGTWVHWTAWDMKPGTAEIKENSKPSGAVEGKTSFGEIGYGGPCPHSGTHRYFFRLYALDIELNLSSGATIKQLEQAMDGHIIDKADLMGVYSRATLGIGFKR